MNVVVDTNVLVAGLLSPFGPPGEIVRMIATGTLRVYYDARILTEYDEVLTRPIFRFHPEQIQGLLDQVKAEGLSVAGHPLPARLSDPTDDLPGNHSRQQSRLPDHRKRKTFSIQ